MNLLGIQDALKNASDQQLMQLMQAPDSTAPSYLVLSELRRRKDMRSQQVQPPQGTVAQDLASEENFQAPMGIRSLSTPEPGDEEYPTEDGVGIEAMREGGPVRMQVGGRPPALPGDFYGTPMADLEGQVRDEAYERAMSGIESGFANRDRQSGINVNETQQAIADIRSRISSGTAPEQALTEALPGYRRADEGSLRQLFDLPPRAVTPSARPAAAPAPVDTGRPAAPAAAMPPPSGAQPPMQRPGSAGGIGAMAAGAPAAAAPAALPTIAQNMERNLGMFPGIPDELMERIRASRTNEGDRRREAQNMALVEAGLRMAASNNPRLGAAFAEGAAPAVQSYTQQLSQIRQDQNADITRELSVAQADLQRRYMAGQISAAELQRQTQMLEIAARERQSLRSEAGANARAGAADSRAERLARLGMERDENRYEQGLARAQAEKTAQEVNKALMDQATRGAARVALRAGTPGVEVTDAKIDEYIENRVTSMMNRAYNQARGLPVSNTRREGAPLVPGVQ